MLLYLSRHKIENLYSEFRIDRSFLERIMPGITKAKGGFRWGGAEGSLEVQHAPQDTDHTAQVLKKLRGKNALFEVISGAMYIRPLNYYICDGTLSYQARIDGPTAGLLPKEIVERYRDIQFFEDDTLKFKLSISHDTYRCVNLTCTAGSIQVFGGMNLSAYHPELFKNELWVRHPSSGDPGILERNLPVRVIFWCLETNEATGEITGSPLVITC